MVGWVKIRLNSKGRLLELRFLVRGRFRQTTVFKAAL